MKTAMQELIEKLEEKIKEFNTKWDGDPLARTGFIISINEAKKLLEKEKEQIIEAFKSARNIQDSDDISITHDWVSAEQYYNETYNN